MLPISRTLTGSIMFKAQAVNPAACGGSCIEKIHTEQQQQQQQHQHQHQHQQQHQQQHAQQGMIAAQQGMIAVSLPFGAGGKEVLAAFKYAAVFLRYSDG